jgi:hypothetical protein
MIPRMRCSWILAGLAVFVVVMVSGREAHAKGGIAVTSGMTKQTGDPTYEYLFEIELLPESTLQTGGFVTIYDILYVPNPLTGQPNLEWGAETLLLGKTPQGFVPVPPDNPNIFNVTWQWNGVPIVNNSTTSYLDLGTFIFGTTAELSSPPSETLVYVGSLNGVTASNSGTITVNAIPEPSAILLLLTGVGALPVLWVRTRRRRPRCQAD